MPAPSNVFTLGFALQSGKGAPAAAPQFITRVQSADVSPTPERDRVEETGTGRDGGDRYTSRIHVTGGAAFVLRPKIAALIAYGILGSKSVAGVAAPYTHLNSPADDQPYLTIFRSLGNVLHERFADCKLSSVTFSGDAGRPIQASLTILGLKPEKLASAPVATNPVETGVALRVPGVDYQIDGGANSAVTTFSVEINAEQNALQTTEIYDSYLEPGLRTINVNYTEVFENLDRYNQSVYGGDNTEPSEEIYHMDWQATFGNWTDGPALRITVPNLALMAAPLEPDPGGDPLTYAVRGEADIPDAGNIIDVSVKNDVAAYAAAA